MFSKSFKTLALPTRLKLETLESRELWALYLWTGGAGVLNPSWSAPSNWSIGGDVATVQPGTGDDVKFDGTAPPGGGAIRPSTVDVAFGGTVKSLKVEAGYTETITLNKNLVVDGPASSPSEIAGGTISGAQSLTFKSTAPAAAGSLTWKAGTLAADTTVESTSALTMTDTADKNLNGKVFTLKGSASWNGQGTLKLSNGGAFWVRETSSMSITGATTIDGTINEVFSVRGTLTLSAAAQAEVVFKAKLANFNAINLTQGNLRTNAIQNSGTLAVSSGSTAYLGDNANAITLLVQPAPDVANKSEITGTGTAVFLPESAVELGSTATVPVKIATDITMDQSSESTTSTSATIGNLEISGTYTWQPPSNVTGTWKGNGTTTIKGSGSTLNLFGWDLAVQRNVDNEGKAYWHKLLPVLTTAKLTLTGTWDNKAASLFSISMLPLLFQAGDQYLDAKLAGAGTFKNRAGAILRNQSSVNVMFDPTYTVIGAGRVEEKSPSIVIPLPYGSEFRFYRKALRFTKLVTSPTGIFDVEQNTAIVFEDGFDQEGGEVNSVGGVGVAVAYNMSGGTADFSGGFEGKSFLADAVDQTDGDVYLSGESEVIEEYDISDGNLTNDKTETESASMTLGELTQSGGSFLNEGEVEVLGNSSISGGTLTSSLMSESPNFTTASLTQTGGDITNAGDFAVTGLGSISGGTLLSHNSSLMGLATFTANTLVQSGGTITNKGNFAVDGEYAISNGSFTTQGMGTNLYTVAMGNVTQTGGSFAISSSPVAFAVAGIYDFNGGTASVYPLPQTMTTSGSYFGQLIVRAENFTLGGIASATAGIHVTSGGKMLIEMAADVTANVLNNGRLDAALGAEIIGSLTNNSIFHLGYSGSLAA